MISNTSARQGREIRTIATHVELVVGGWLDRAVGGERLDDLDCFVELGFGHGEWVDRWCGEDDGATRRRPI